MIHRGTWVCAALCAVVATAAASALAQTYPSKPIRFVTAMAAGTTVDIRARQVGERVAKSIGQPVIVENRPGAGGTLAAAYVARAAPDGYTVLVGTVAEQAIALAIYPKLDYDPRKDFAPITQYAETATLLVANPALGVTNMQQLIALARAKPGRLSLGSWGNGTLTHLLTVQLAQVAGIDIQHVPYKNQAQALSDVVGGQIDLFWDYPVTSLSFIRAGRLRGLMVVGDRRVQPLPDVQSAAEAGLPAIRHKAWGGFLAPAGTPRPVVDRLNAEIVKALRSPEMERILAEQGSRVVTNTPDEFAAFIRREQEELAQLAKAAGARVE
jgi:tripartite-type tricarboxylate transporter receptor subunit TctC